MRCRIAPGYNRPMRLRGAQLVVRALEDAGVRFAFGIPGTHTIELYDALERSTLTPVLVASELGAAFMADGVARSSVGVAALTVVPGAGVTMALSGIAEAFMDQVPLVVVAAGVRADTGYAYQLHAVDQLAILAPVTKAALRVSSPELIYPTVLQAVALARAGVPGPVAVEVPADLLMLSWEVGELLPGEPSPAPDGVPAADLVELAARLLGEAEHPVLYLGAGAAGASALAIVVAEQVGAPVVTTISGKGVFPEHHPLWLWNGFGAQAPPFVRRIVGRADCLLAVGCRFAEVATGSYGIDPPANLIHVDLDPAVFNRNVPARLAVAADAGRFLAALGQHLAGQRLRPELVAEIADGHADERAAARRRRASDRVNPDALFAALQRCCAADAVFTVDSGNGAFLAMENLRLDAPGRFLAPVDFSCMGYGVPSAIGAALAQPGRDVVAVVGDGAFLMTGLELLTAAAYRAAPLVVVLRDGKLGQIAELQSFPLNRTTCTLLPDYSLEDLTRAVGAAYFRLLRDGELEPVLSAALSHVRQGTPAVVEVRLDDRQPTWFARGMLRTTFWRLDWPQRLRMLARAAWRHLGG